MLSAATGQEEPNKPVLEYRQRLMAGQRASMASDIVWFLQTNLLPDGDSTQGLMAEVIDQGYRHLDEADPKAIAAYLRSLPPDRERRQSEITDMRRLDGVFAAE